MVARRSLLEWLAKKLAGILLILGIGIVADCAQRIDSTEVLAGKIGIELREAVFKTMPWNKALDQGERSGAQ